MGLLYLSTISIVALLGKSVQLIFKDNFNARLFGVGAALLASIFMSVFYIQWPNSVVDAGTLGEHLGGHASLLTWIACSVIGLGLYGRMTKD